MAGGTFDRKVGKVRPGTYINFESTRQVNLGLGDRGIVLIPLIAHGYGPAKQFITLESNAPDASMSLLGFSVADDNPSMLLIREAFKRARRVIVYIPNQGTKATVVSGNLTASAKYGGSRGNDIRLAVVANPVGGFDVTVFLGTVLVSEYAGLSTVADLIAQNDPWLDFAGDGDLSAVAGVSLAGGTDGTLTASDMTAFLDDSESVRWNTMAFPLEETGETDDPVPSLKSAVFSKIQYLREGAGKRRVAVVPNLVCDYEGIINLTNAVSLESGDLTIAQTTAWVAGATAGASVTESNTFVKYEGAVGIVGQKNNAEAVAAINNGEFFFSVSEQGDIVVEYDINSLTTFLPPKDKTYRKNRVIRVFDTFAEEIVNEFPPNRYDNSADGWDVMEGIGKSVLLRFEEEGAIKNVDYDNDFLVDREASADDEVYFNVGLEPIDSAEKLYFTVKTR